MTTTELKSELNRQLTNDEITVEEYTVAMKYVDAAEYRSGYNRRPEVKAKRREYNRNRWAEIKAGRQIAAGIVGKIGK